MINMMIKIMTYVDSTADGQKKFVEDVSYHDISCSNDGDIASHAAVIATGTCYRYLKPEKVHNSQTRP